MDMMTSMRKETVARSTFPGNDNHHLGMAWRKKGKAASAVNKRKKATAALPKKHVVNLLDDLSLDGDNDHDNGTDSVNSLAGGASLQTAPA